MSEPSPVTVPVNSSPLLTASSLSPHARASSQIAAPTPPQLDLTPLPLTPPSALVADLQAMYRCVRDIAFDWFVSTSSRYAAHMAFVHFFDFFFFQYRRP
jgi:hypothetical protein